MRKAEAGQALVVAAVTLTVLMLAAALGIDMGYLRLQQRRMQSAADSAALAGASELQYGGQAYSTAATTDASRNGFDTNKTCAGGASIQVNNPPSSPPFSTDDYVEVVLCQETPTFFMRALGQTFSTVRVRSVAKQVSSPGCLYALPGGTGIVVDDNNTIANASANCAVLDDSSFAVTRSGYESHRFYATGGVGYIAGTTCEGCDGTTLHPNPPVPIAPVTDPLAFVPAPPGPGTCPSGGTTEPYQPGKFAYPCGLQIIANQVDVNLSSGTYSIGGSGLSIDGFLSPDGSAGKVTGLGVTFYMTGGSSVSIESQGVVVGGQTYVEHVYYNCDAGASGLPTATTPPSIVRLTAPTDPGSPYSGILFMQDPADTASAQIAIGNGDTCTNWGGANDGSNASYLWGALYFPSADNVILNGIGFLNNPNPPDTPPPPACSTVPRLTLVVAKSLLLSGAMNIGTNDCTVPPTPVTTGPSTLIPKPIKAALLVE